MFSTNYLASGKLPSVWDAINELQARVNSLNATVIEQQARISELQSKLGSLNNTLTLRIEALELNQSALAERIAALEDLLRPPHEVTFLYDRFDTGLDNWTYWGGAGYMLQWDSNTAKISGDGYNVNCGMQKVVDLSEWNESGVLLLSFDYRATSDLTYSSTVANLWVQDADSGSSLYLRNLVEGGTTDTGWQNYGEDISSYVRGYSRIRIILWLRDAWSADWNQTNAYDNVKLTSTEP